MNDISELRGRIDSLFLPIEWRIISFLSGYPNFAIGKDVNSITDVIENDLKKSIDCNQDSQYHQVVLLLSRIQNQIQEFYTIDKQAGEWVLLSTKRSQRELFKQCKNEVQVGILEKMIEADLKYPEWLDLPNYQKFIYLGIPVFKEYLQCFKDLGELILHIRKIGSFEGLFLSNEWVIGQDIECLQLIFRDGIKAAIPEIIQKKKSEANPLAWMQEQFSQRVDDMLDESQSYQVEKAIWILKDAFRYKPNSIQQCQLYYQLACNYEDREMWNEAIDSYTQMLSVAPPNGVGLFFRAKIKHLLGKNIEAKMDLEQALSLSPLHVFILDEYQRRDAKKLLDEIEQEMCGK